MGWNRRDVGLERQGDSAVDLIVRLVTSPELLAALAANASGAGVASATASMRADAELSVATLSRESLFWPNSRVMHAITLWLTGEVDQADELFADVAEEADEMGAANAVSVSGRACSHRARTRCVGRGGAARGPAVRVIRQSLLEEYPTSALVYAVAAQVAGHRAHARGAQAFLTRAQRLRPRLTYVTPLGPPSRLAPEP